MLAFLGRSGHSGRPLYFGQSKPRPTRGGKAGVALLNVSASQDTELPDYLTPAGAPLKIISACVPPSPARGCAAECALSGIVRPFIFNSPLLGIGR